MTSNNPFFLSNQAPVDYIDLHKKAFNISPLYPLKIFEQFLEETEDFYWIESSCKISREKLVPTRFNISFIGNDTKIAQELERILRFFRQIENRSDVKINYELLWNFLENDFDFKKVEAIQTGVDLRENICNSSIKIYIKLKNYPEKLEKAITLYGGIVTPELRQLFLYHCSFIGFDFYLNGRSEIELYPKIKCGEFTHPIVQNLMQLILSPQAINYLPVCDMLGMGLSKANFDKIIYCHSRNKNDLPKYFNINNVARKVHDFYQQQPTLPGMWVGLPERELQGELIQNITLYYQKTFSRDE